MELTKEVLDRFPDGVCIINPDFRIEWVNKALRDRGFKIEDISGHKCYQVYKNKNKLCKECPSLKAFAKGKTIRHLEFGADGKRYEVTAIPVMHEGKVEKVIECVREVETVDHVKLSEVFSFMRDFFFVVDENFNITYANKAAIKTFGPCVGKKCYNVVHKTGKPIEGCPFVKAQLTKKVENFEVYHDKLKRWFLVTANPVVRDGKVIACAHYMKDITESKKINEQLIEIKKKYLLLSKNIKDAIFAKDIERKYTFVNTSAEKMIGLPAAKIVGKRPEDIFSPREAGMIKSLDDRCFRGEDVDEVRELTLKGKSRFLHTHQTPSYDEDGKVIGITGVVRDVTDSMTAEIKTKNAEHRYRNLFENAGDAILTSDLKGFITDANQAVSRYGFKRDEIIGQNRLIFVPKKYHARASKNLAKVIDGKTVEGEVELITPKGIIPSSFVHTPIVEDGKLVGVQTILKDISETKRAQKLAETYLQLAGVMMVAIDPDGKIMLMNKKGYGILGYEPESLIGKNWFDTCIPKKDAVQVKKVFRRCMAGKIKLVENFQNPVLRKDGSERIINWHNTLLKSDDGTIIGTLSSGEDITEWKSDEDALKKREALLNEVGDIAKIGGWEMDLVTRKAKWTKGTYDIVEIGYDKPIPGPDEHISYYLKEDQHIVKKAMEDLIKRNIPLNFEARLRTVKGKIKWCRALGRAIRINGKCVKIHGTFQDITEIKKAEYNILVSEKRYRRLFESAQDAILIIDADSGKIIDANPFIKDLLDYPLEWFLGKRLWEISPLKDVVSNRKKFRKLQQKKYVRYEDMPLQSRHGKEMAVEFVSNVYNVDSRKIIQCNIRDITDRKKIQDQLKQSEERYRRTLGGMLEGCQIIGFDWRYKYLNDTAVKHGRMPRKKIIGYRMMDVYPGIEKTELFSALKRCMKERKPVNIENLFNYPDGTRCWFELRIEPVPEGLFILSIDITERKKAKVREEYLTDTINVLRNVNEAMLRQSDRESLLNYIVKVLTEAKMYSCVFLALTEGMDVKKIYYTGSKKCSITERLKIHDKKYISAVKRCNGVKVLRDVTKTPFKQHFHGKIPSHPALASQLKYAGNDYGILTIHLPAHVIPTEKDKSLFKELAEDISFSLYNLEIAEKLQVSEHNYKQLFESMADPIFVADAHSRRLVDCNKKAENITGYSRKEILNMKADQLHPKELIESTMRGFTMQVRGKMFYVETELLTKDNRRIPVSINTKVLKIRGRELLIGVFRDISQIKKAQRTMIESYNRLKDVDRLKSTLIRDVSHELKTPVSTISIAAHLLDDHIKAGSFELDKVNNYLDIITRNADRFRNEVTSILEMSRMQSLEDIERSRIDICRILYDTASDFRDEAKRRGLKIICKKIESVRISANPGLLKTMFRNLIGNALKNTSKGYVKVRCLCTKDRVGVSVKDTGKGMPKAFMKEMFKPFVKASPDQEGFGIGLAIVSKIVKLHDAKITVNSKVGKGTEFKVMFKR